MTRAEQLGSLAGRKVIITRAVDQAEMLSLALQEHGAVTIALPSIEIAPPVDRGMALRQVFNAVDVYEWVIFTSTNTVTAVAGVCDLSRIPAQVKLAAVGPRTAKALADHGVVVDLVPDRFVAEALLEAFPSATRTVDTERILIPQAETARSVLPEGLRSLGWTAEVVTAYRTLRTEVPESALEEAKTADAIVFTASSTVHNFVEIYGYGLVPPVVACIGPVTASTASDLGLTVDVVAKAHTIEGLAAALVDYYSH